MKIRNAVAAALLLAVLPAGPGTASPPPADDAQPVIAGNYTSLFDDFAYLGCLTGAVSGAALGYGAFATGPLATFFFTMNGCSLGMLLGPVGVLIHDTFTGDNAVERFLRDTAEQVDKANRPTMPKLPPPESTPIQAAAPAEPPPGAN